MPGIQTDKPINLTLLKPAEIGQITIGKGADIKLGLWDRIKDFFRAGTKQATIDALVKEMQEPGDNLTAHLGNFEKITSHAKPEELWRFGVDLPPEAVDGGRNLNFKIGEEVIASQTFNVGEKGSEKAARVGAYVALNVLRAAVTDVRNPLPPFIDRKQLATQITGLIKGSLTQDLKGLRRQYGELARGLEAKLADAPKDIAELSDDPSHPLLSPQVGVQGLQQVLHGIDATLTANCGPRPKLRDLPSLEPQEIESLLESDADLSGASAQGLMEKIKQASGQAGSNPFLASANPSNPFERPSYPLGGVSLDQMLDWQMDFEGFDIKQWVDLDKDTGKASLDVLMSKGAKGGGFQLFAPPPPQGYAPGAHFIKAIKFYGPSSEGKKIPLGDIIKAGFDVSGVPLDTLKAHFDLEGSLMLSLNSSKVDLRGQHLRSLRDQKIRLDGTFISLLVNHEVSFEGEKIAELQKFGRFGWKGAPLGELLRQKADFTGVSVQQLKAQGASFAGVSYQQLRDNHFDLSGLSLGDLAKLNGESGFFTGVPMSELPGDEPAVPAEPAPGNTPAVAQLLGQGVSFKDFEIAELQRRNADLSGCFVDTLLNQEQANFAGVSVKWLKDGGASFAGVTYRTLRDAGCEFGGVTAEDLVQIGKDGKFFDKVSVDELTGNEELKGKLSGFTLTELLDGGARLGNVSLGELINAGIKPDLQGLTMLAAQNPAKPIEVKALLEMKISFQNFEIAALQGQKASLKGCFVDTLLNQEQANFAGVSVKWLKEAGASFAGVTYKQLREAGCNFREVTTADLQDLLKLGVFKGATTLSLVGQGAEDLERALKGCTAQDLIRGGVAIGDGGLSITQLVTLKLLKAG